MKLFNIFLVLSICTLLLGSELSHYILVTKTSKKSNLKFIKSKLDAIKVKMYIKNSNSKYFVYSQSYENKDSAKYALRKVKHYFPSARLITKSSTVPKVDSISNITDKNLFMVLTHNNSTVKIDTDTVSDNETEGKSTSYSIEAGYLFDKNIFVTLSYLDSSTDDLGVSNIYISTNYQLNVLKDTSLYMGVLGGFSSLELKGFDESEVSRGMLFGGQAGVVYSIYKDISLSLSYQMIIIDHTIEFSDTNSSMNFDLINNIQLGVQYRF